MNELQNHICEALLNDYLYELELSKSFIGEYKILSENTAKDVLAVISFLKSNKTLAFVFDDETTMTVEKALHILNHFDSCVICFSLPSLPEAQMLIEKLENENLSKLCIGIIVYDKYANIKVLKSFQIPDNLAVQRTETEWKSYWCWWRDSSHYEVADLLKLSLSYDKEQGDIYSQYVYPKFFNMLISGETRQWDGKPRVKKYSSASYKAEKQNYKIPMCQLGFWDVETGHITIKGKKLLEIVNRFGADSDIFIDSLAKIILIDGKHLNLVKDLDEFQKDCPEYIPKSSSEFFILFDSYMTNRNSMGTRKPSAVKTGAKRSYVRDEPKLWNKLGIINTFGNGRYYQPFKGISFNWERINKILLSNVLGEGK